MWLFLVVFFSFTQFEQTLNRSAVSFVETERCEMKTLSDQDLRGCVFLGIIQIQIFESKNKYCVFFAGQIQKRIMNP